MLYQTHPPLFFQFHPFPHSLSVLAASSSSLPSVCSHLPLLQAETQMECEAALKTSFRTDTAMKFNPQCFIEDLSALNVPNVAPSDDVFVDELLDFSHMEEVEPPEEDEQKDGSGSAGSASGSVSPPPPQHQSREISNFVSTYVSVPSSELSVPADDLANLEWLSHFVEDSFSEYSTAYPAGTPPEKPKTHLEKRPEPQTPVLAHPCFQSPVPAKARSKRTRTGGRVWSLRSPSFAESSSSSTSSSSSSSPMSPWLIYTNAPPEQVCSEAKPPTKKPKKKTSPDAAAGAGSAAQTPRRCTHCGVHKTPQWRTGPLGAKTLCNACGVRYKSGRLLPEYRPACSPTFSSELHSNHHRKVLEMRRKKEGMDGVESGLGIAPTPAVPSFG